MDGIEDDTEAVQVYIHHVLKNSKFEFFTKENEILACYTE